ncbi:CHC2 zinc finger domain-containing protein [Brevibacillus panacihumi]|uniref:CHC2 zinc finger domain-containing protein n=1 Tax=Brevibacillus panacihumi TaxID=497735 RepID=UPI003D0519F0
MGATLLELVKDHLTIEEACEMADVNLERGRGNTRTARCPFHDDSSPSFIIYLDSNRWRCFGCHCHGDVVDLLSKVYNMPISQTLHRIATDLGISTHNRKRDELQRQRIEQQRKERQKAQAAKEFEWAVTKAVHFLKALSDELDRPIRACTTPWQIEKYAAHIHLNARIERILDDLVSGERNRREDGLLAAKGVLFFVKEARKKQRDINKTKTA